jgi:hypothetical protein
MESSISENLLERVIEQDTVARKAVLNHDIISLFSGVNQIADLRQQVLEVTIHGQHVPTRGGTISIRECVADTMGRQADHRLDPDVLLRQLMNDLRRAVPAIIVDGNNFVNILAVQFA